MMHTVYTVARQPQLLPGLVAQKLSGQWRKWQDLSRITRILPAIPPAEGAPPPTDWRVQRVQWPEWSLTGVTVALVGPAGQAPRAVIKLPHTRTGAASLQRQQRILAALYADSRLADLRPLLPRPLGAGGRAGQFYALEAALPGACATDLMFDPTACRHLQAAAATVLRRLHGATAASVVVDARRLARWVDAPVRVVGRVISRLSAPAYYAAATRRLRDELHNVLAGRTVTTSWIHGDFWPGNLLVGAESAIVGIVDWERAADDELPLHDLLHLLLFTRKQVRHCGEADIVAALAGGIRWTPDEHALIRGAQALLPEAPIEERTAVLLYWLRHTAATLALLPEYGQNPDYLANNIESVLQHL